MEDAFHGCLDGIVVEIDRFWVVCSALRAEWLSGGEQGFDGFVAENEEGSHRPETGQERLVAAGVGRSAGAVFVGRGVCVRIPVRRVPQWTGGLWSSVV